MGAAVSSWKPACPSYPLHLMRSILSAIARAVHLGCITLLMPAASISAVAQSVAPAYFFSHFAGSLGGPGSTDGIGSAARFYAPSSSAMDSTGNLYIADSANYTIRKITPGGVVTTFAGTPGVSASVDGTGTSAQFILPKGVAVDRAGIVYVSDENTIRKITPGGRRDHFRWNSAPIRRCRWHRSGCAIPCSRRIGGGQRGDSFCGGLRQQRDPENHAGRCGDYPGGYRS